MLILFDRPRQAHHAGKARSSNAGPVRRVSQTFVQSPSVKSKLSDLNHLVQQTHPFCCSPSLLICWLVWPKSYTICRNDSINVQTIRTCASLSVMPLGRSVLPWLGQLTNDRPPCACADFPFFPQVFMNVPPVKRFPPIKLRMF